jgi:hypothetical protein
MNISNVNHLVHAYKIAPWRIQRQWIGAALLAVLAFAMVAAIYLDVTAKTAIAGREIQDLHASLTISQQNSANLQSELASLTSTALMRERALTLGFRPVETGEMEYLIVPGYFKPEPAILDAALPQMSSLTMPREYNESLIEWLDEKISDSARGLQ